MQIQLKYLRQLKLRVKNKSEEQRNIRFEDNQQQALKQVKQK